MRNRTEKEEEEILFEKYKLLISARNFHYDNFSKWLTYFYVAIGALFIAYYSILTSDKIDSGNRIFLLILLPILGYIVSLLWYWSCKGYYFWNINFIMLVNHYEKDLLQFKKEESVYYAFANKDVQNDYQNPISGANISTSKVAILFSFTISTIWGILSLYHLYKSFDCSISNNVWVKFILIDIAIRLSVFTTIIISKYIPPNFLASYIDHMPNLKLRQDPIKE